MIYDINGNVVLNKNVLDFNNNIDVDYEFDSATNANYTVIRIYQTKQDGTKQYPFVRVPSTTSVPYTALDLARTEEWLLTINCGLGMASQGIPVDGIAIENGVLLHDSPAEYHIGSIPLTIDGNGNLSYTETDPSGETLIANGIVSAIMGFCPIIVDYAPVDPPTVEHVSHFTQNAQRQIIGQFGNGDYAIITCEGRNFDHSDGWTIAEAQTICQKIGLKFAYNCDGGGSTETVLGKKQINTIYENQTGRKIPSFIVFNGKDTFSIPNA